VALLEMVHAGSMVVDDIEDGSTERRGAPALHLTVGLPLALNTGNWLYFLPLGLLRSLGLPTEVELGMHRLIVEVMRDCHVGQALDLTARVGEVADDQVGDVVLTTTTLKTGRLVGLAAALGVLAAGDTEAVLGPVRRFGEEVGIGLQMLDDLGNLAPQGPEARRFEDLKGGRLTWPWALACQHLSGEERRELVARARSVMRHRDERETWALASDLREKVGGPCRLAAHWRLNQALGALRRALPTRASLDGVPEELARLEASYA
jgi:geranylgeranyl pyrophosphate synthase